MQEIRLKFRFVRGSGWDSKVIERGTLSWCSHVESIFGGSTFGAMLRGGVTWRSVADKIYRDVSRYEVWSIPVTEEQYRKVSEFIGETFGDPYDWRDIVSMVLGIRWSNPEAWICSEWAITLLEYIGAAKRSSEEPDDRVTPLIVYEIFTNLEGSRKEYELDK